MTIKNDIVKEDAQELGSLLAVWAALPDMALAKVLDISIIYSTGARSSHTFISCRQRQQTACNRRAGS